MPNKSKLKEKRFWERWRNEGKVGTYMSSINLVTLAQKAFALAINEMAPAIRPQFTDIKVKIEGNRHTCRWDRNDPNHEGMTIEGTFFRHSHQSFDKGVVCVVYVREGIYHGYPHTWSYLYYIDQMYEAMHNAPAYEVKKVNDEDIMCPGCKDQGLVSVHFIPGDTCFSGSEHYCHGCGTTF